MGKPLTIDYFPGCNYFWVNEIFRHHNKGIVLYIRFYTNFLFEKLVMMITLSYLYEMKNGFVMFFSSLSPFGYLFAITSRLMMTSENVGNKQKGRISKQVFQENKVSQIF